MEFISEAMQVRFALIHFDTNADLDSEHDSVLTVLNMWIVEERIRGSVVNAKSVF